MSEPSTTLDERFSDPGTQATSWTAARTALENAELFWISTVRADGRPHVTPLVAVWLDDALYFTTGPPEQKAVNLTGNPWVVLTTGCNGWEGGLDVMVVGEATRVTDRAALDRLAAAWSKKWDGRWRFEPTDEGFGHEAGAAHVFEVRQAKVLAFTKGRFTQTRFQPTTRP